MHHLLCPLHLLRRTPQHGRISRPLWLSSSKQCWQLAWRESRRAGSMPGIVCMLWQP